MAGRYTGLNLSDALEVAGFASSRVLGFNPYETWSLLKKLAIKSKDHERWLDWVGKNWWEVYLNDVPRVVCIDLTESRLVVPQVN